MIEFNEGPIRKIVLVASRFILKGKKDGQSFSQQSLVKSINTELNRDYYTDIHCDEAEYLLENLLKESLITKDEKEDGKEYFKVLNSKKMFVFLTNLINDIENRYIEACKKETWSGICYSVAH